MRGGYRRAAAAAGSGQIAGVTEEAVDMLHNVVEADGVVGQVRHPLMLTHTRQLKSACPAATESNPAPK